MQKAGFTRCDPSGAKVLNPPGEKADLSGWATFLQELADFD